MRVTTFSHLDPARLGWVRFQIPHGTYSLEDPPKEFYHDLMEKNTLEWKLIQDDGMCKKTTKNGDPCKNKANTFTNGHWTCKKHASHPSIPDMDYMTKNFEEGNYTICCKCQKDIPNVHDLCITSCNHAFHKDCLLNSIDATSNEETYFDCPSCKHPLHIFGLPPNECEYDFNEIANMPIDEDMEKFIDEYVNTHDMSFLL